MKKTNISITYSPFSLEFIKEYIITMRPYLMFVSGITGIAGLSFIENLSIVQSILIFSASFLSYGFGQALTDCFQVDTDSISSPYRPLARGVVSKTDVLIVSLSGLILTIAVFSYYQPYNILLGAAAGIGLYTYTYFKRKWWAGPFYNSWIVLVLFLMAFLIGYPSSVKINSILFLAMTTVFFGYANFVLTGYFKDIAADKATFYNTLPVVFGRKVSSLISDVFALFTIIPAVIIFWNSAPGLNSTQLIAALIFLIAGLTRLAKAQFTLHKIDSDEEAHKAIAPVVHTYILILSSIAITQKNGWIIPLSVFYLMFIFVMKMRPAKSQI